MHLYLGAMQWTNLTMRKALVGLEVLKVREEGSVFPPHQSGSLHLLQDDILLFLLVQCLQPVFQQNVHIVCRGI